MTIPAQLLIKLRKRGAIPLPPSTFSCYGSYLSTGTPVFFTHCQPPSVIIAITFQYQEYLMKHKLNIHYTSVYRSLAVSINEAHKITHSRLEYIRLICSTAWASNLFMVKVTPIVVGSFNSCMGKK